MTGRRAATGCGLNHHYETAQPSTGAEWGGYNVGAAGLRIAAGLRATLRGSRIEAFRYAIASGGKAKGISKTSNNRRFTHYNQQRPDSRLKLPSGLGLTPAVGYTCRGQRPCIRAMAATAAAFSAGMRLTDRAVNNSGFL